jgi:hypothetical protein
MNDVRRQLIVEERNGRIIKWYDRKIPPGVDWRSQIDHRLERAAIILLFLSPHFIESDYCYEIEGHTALSRYDAGTARVIPIILRPCLWRRSPYGKLQALPRDAMPVSRWPDRDEACMDVAAGVMTVVDELVQGRRLASGARPAETSGASRRVDGAEKIERLMPALLDEMRQDLRAHPTSRVFVVLKRGWVYNHEGLYLTYFLDQHEDLEGKLLILENLGLIREVTNTNVRRFAFEEQFVDYLVGSCEAA